METKKEESNKTEEDNQKMPFLEQFFVNEQLEATNKNTKNLHKNNNKKRKRRTRNKNSVGIRHRNKYQESDSNIPDSLLLWVISFTLFSIMGYMLDLKLILLLPVIFVAFIIHLIEKTPHERNKILRHLNLIDGYIAFKLLICPRRQSNPSPSLSHYDDELEHPLLVV